MAWTARNPPSRQFNSKLRATRARRATYEPEIPGCTVSPISRIFLASANAAALPWSLQHKTEGHSDRTV
jgi:hypothetical protein